MHPASIVHSLVRFRDGALLAHLGHPDMRVPISFALGYPDRPALTAAPLDLSQGLDLRFEAVDDETFPLLPLARAAGERGGTAPCAYNAANEVAVEAFLDGRIGFLEIADTVAGGSRRGRRIAGARSRRSRRSRRRGAPARRAEARARMTIFISIVGLGFLIFIHELGHFSASLALGMRPRKFYIGFPPAIVKRTRKGIEYGIGDDPARRVREDSRACIGRLRRRRSCARPCRRRRRPELGDGRPSVCAVRSHRAITTRPEQRSRHSPTLAAEPELSEPMRHGRSRRASPTSETHSAPMPTGGLRPGGASSSSSPGPLRTSSSRS